MADAATLAYLDTSSVGQQIGQYLGDSLSRVVTVPLADILDNSKLGDLLMLFCETNEGIMSMLLQATGEEEALLEKDQKLQARHHVGFIVDQFYAYLVANPDCVNPDYLSAWIVGDGPFPFSFPVGVQGTIHVDENIIAMRYVAAASQTQKGEVIIWNRRSNQTFGDFRHRAIEWANTRGRPYYMTAHKDSHINMMYSLEMANRDKSITLDSVKRYADANPRTVIKFRDHVWGHSNVAAAFGPGYTHAYLCALGFRSTDGGLLSFDTIIQQFRLPKRTIVSFFDTCTRAGMSTTEKESIMTILSPYTLEDSAWSYEPEWGAEKTVSNGPSVSFSAFKKQRATPSKRDESETVSTPSNQPPPPSSRAASPLPEGGRCGEDDRLGFLRTS
jgi:hypothetical protein